MKDIMIRGKYFEVDFSRDIIIQKTDEETIKTLLDTIIKERSLAYMDRYNQGFLDINDPELLDDLPKIMEDLKNCFISNIVYGINLETTITHFIQMLEMKGKFDEDLMSYIWEIYDRFETKMYFKDFVRDEPIILKLINSDPQHLFELPKNVVGIVYENRPCVLEIDILESKSVVHIINKEKYKVGSYHKFRKYDLGLLPGLALEEKSVTRSERGKFQLGISIHKRNQIPTDINIDPDYIIVEPEKAYIFTSGIACLARRQTFYKYLFEAFPNSDIIVSLPKLEILDVYFNQGNDTKLDKASMINHSSLYETELNALFKYPNDNIKLSIPDIENVDDFNNIRKHLELACQSRFGKKVKIGVEVNTEYSTTNLSLFKRFNHAVINLNKCFEKIRPKEICSVKYAMQYSDLHNILYRKSKDAYLLGKDLNKPVFLQKMMYRGFKKFTIKPELFALYSTIIYRYNQGERMYDKTV